MYSKNIQVLLDLYKLFYNHELLSTIIMHDKAILYRLEDKNRIFWNGYELRVINDGYAITIFGAIDLQKYETNNYKNIISFLTNRIKICVDSSNLYSNVGMDKKVHTISTYDLLKEEEHFQYCTVADIPDMDTIQDLCNISNEIVKLKLHYDGTYMVNKWDFKSILRYLKKTYPEKDGHYWSLDD